MVYIKNRGSDRDLLGHRLLRLGGIKDWIGVMNHICVFQRGNQRLGQFITYRVLRTIVPSFLLENNVASKIIVENFDQ